MYSPWSAISDSSMFEVCDVGTWGCQLLCISYLQYRIRWHLRMSTVCRCTVCYTVSYILHSPIHTVCVFLSFLFGFLFYIVFVVFLFYSVLCWLRNLLILILRYIIIAISYVCTYKLLYCNTVITVIPSALCKSLLSTLSTILCLHIYIWELQYSYHSTDQSEHVDIISWELLYHTT